VGVAMDKRHGSCLASAERRAVIRKLVTAEHQPNVRLSKDEHAALERFFNELAFVLAVHVDGRSSTKSENLARTAS